MIKKTHVISSVIMPLAEGGTTEKSPRRWIGTGRNLVTPSGRFPRNDRHYLKHIAVEVHFCCSGFAPWECFWRNPEPKGFEFVIRTRLNKNKMWSKK